VLLVRWSRYGLVGVPVMIALGLAVAGPVPFLLALIQPGYRVAGTVVALGPAAVLAWSIGRARVGVLDAAYRGDHLGDATDEETLAVHAAVRAARVPTPTLVVPDGGLPRPLVLRGLRWSFVLAMPTHLAQPEALVEVIRADRRTGTDRLAMWLPALASVHAGWRAALRMSTVTVRRGPYGVSQRFAAMTLLLLAPFAAISWALSWVALQIVVAVLPRDVVASFLELSGNARYVHDTPKDEVVQLATGLGPDLSAQIAHGRTALVGGRRRPAPRTWWSTPRALADPLDQVSLDGAAAAIAGIMFIGLGSFPGLGMLPAQRIAWPWEQGPQTAQVLAVDVLDESDETVLGRMGFDVGYEFTPTVRLEDGREITLPVGTQRVAVGDEITVVPSDDGRTGRSLTQDSLFRILSLGLVYVAAAAGMLRATCGPVGLAKLRHLAQIDHHQRGLTGRRRRRRAPKDLFGMNLFRT
jgi:hypothetical protein